MSGRVVGPDGRGVPGATVTLSTQHRARDVVGAWTRDDEQVARLLADTPLERQVEAEVSRYFSQAIEDLGATVSGDDGVFTIMARRPLREAFQLIVSAGVDLPGGRAVGWAATRPRRDGQLQVGDMVVELPQTIPVFVEAAGAPLAGALVTIETAFSWRGVGFDEERFSWFTDGDGRARVLLMPGHRLSRVRAAKAGFASAQATAAPGAEGVAAFDLAPEAAIRGVLLDSVGSPVPDVLVDARNAADRDALEAGWTRTDAEGRFVLGGLTPGRTYRIESGEGDTGDRGARETVAAPAHGVALRMWATPRLQVELVLPDGFMATADWLADFRVVLVELGPDGGSSSTSDVRLVNDGRTRTVSKVSPGEYRVSHTDVGAPTRARLAPVRSPRVVVGEREVSRIELRAAVGRTISGRVVDAQHAPVGRAELYLPEWSLAFEADEAGQFELGGLPLEPFELAVFDAEGERARVTIPAGASALPEIVVPTR